MKNRFFTMLAALVLMLGVAGTAQAQAVVTKTSTAQLESILKQEGYSYVVDKDGDLVLKLDGYTALLLISRQRNWGNTAWCRRICFCAFRDFYRKGDFVAKKICAAPDLDLDFSDRLRGEKPRAAAADLPHGPSGGGRLQLYRGRDR